MAGSAGNDKKLPLWLLAELTYRCPLQCPYCSNPVNYNQIQDEMDGEQWRRILREARQMGAVQLGLSGGEPLLHRDLDDIVAEAGTLGFYSNLITSGIGRLDASRMAVLKERGLNHIQLSMQADNAALNDKLSASNSFEKKKQVAKWIKEAGYPMVLNVVLHRENIDRVEEILQMAETLGADYIELANTQYYGWALLNRDHLLPSRQQLERAEERTERFRQHSAMTIYFVVPDYYAERPKACMNGWGAVFLTIAPDGVALPCHSARMLPDLDLPRVQDHSLRWIWEQSAAFNRYRGEDWMAEPCRQCPERQKDFGGCRCQAYLLTGKAENADPVCHLSPHHGRIEQALLAAGQAAAVKVPFVYRNVRQARQLQEKN